MRCPTFMTNAKLSCWAKRSSCPPSCDAGTSMVMSSSPRSTPCQHDSTPDNPVICYLSGACADRLYADADTRALTCWLPFRSVEVSQQPLEGLLICVMRLPAPKVTNVPGIAIQRWQAGLQGHDGVVNPDREEDGGALLTLPCQGGLHLVFHPLARHRRLGQAEEQLVIHADGLVNAGAESVADFHIFRGKPAAHALVLQICV